MGFAAPGIEVPFVARADNMDPTVHRLGISGPNDSTPCSTDGTNLRAGVGQCFADNATYQRLVLQLGTAVASAGLSPARTVGYRHFYVGVEVATTSVGGSSGAAPPVLTGTDPAADRNASAAWREDNFFRLATEGNPIAPSGNAGTDQTVAATRYAEGNRFTASALTWTRIAFRKGLPLGLEIGGSAGRVMQTSLWAFSFEVKWSLFEGFRHRWPAAFPDLAVRGSVTAVAGIRGFQLTVPTFDIRLSKSFVIGSSVVLSPYVAGQAVWIMADSEVIDVTPGNLADNDGDQSIVVFDRIREWHPRILAGLEVRYTRFVVNGAFRYDLLDPARNFNNTHNAPKQWSVDVGVGVVY